MNRIDDDTAVMLREAVDKHARRNMDPGLVRSRRSTTPGYAPSHLQALAEQGWLAAFVPEAADGMELGVDAAAILTEGLAPSLLVAPLDSFFLATRTLVGAGAGSDLFAGFAEGETLPVLAFQERPGDVFAPQTAQTVCDASGRITGGKAFVVGHAGAGRFIVTAKRGAALILAMVEAGAQGVETETQWRADGTPIGQVRFDNAPSVIVADDTATVTQAIGLAVDEANLVVAAELMAHIDAMMAMTLEHLRTRVQFGKPIGAFQALQHRAVDLYVRQLLSRSVLDPAVGQVAEGMEPFERSRLVSRVRCRLNDTARLVARESIQLFGAMGITEECDLSLHVKRVLALTTWLGTSGQHRAQFAQSLASSNQNFSHEEIMP
ncbi:acyl-CoA dehydrogenase family protein [Pelagibacterium lacus]|uniref:Acyl-CoA dehydrogenase n=1 Tax=Pelagibacterium lacus TaxID=2282655 RepID=A0A369W5F4_9HYPH|nr:acyl-CoA dehydrogenase family protein [Pelagibacterium lacus]RDE09573.1 acyl-CoA dehydrogenase [Pelagibacterium lacus]